MIFNNTMRTEFFQTRGSKFFRFPTPDASELPLLHKLITRKTGISYTADEKIGDFFASDRRVRGGSGVQQFFDRGEFHGEAEELHRRSELRERRIGEREPQVAVGGVAVQGIGRPRAGEFDAGVRR